MRVFKTFPLSSFTPFRNPGRFLSLGARAANPTGTARTRAVTHTCRPSAAVGHHDGNLAPPRSRRPVRLAITAVPKITPTPEKPENPAKTFPLNSREILLIFLKLFPIFFPIFYFFSSSYFSFSFLPFSLFFPSFLFPAFFLLRPGPRLPRLAPPSRACAPSLQAGSAPLPPLAGATRKAGLRLQ
jgi:hypothetical protein